ncbi:phosphotransferase [Lacisediminihabitans sp. H27-G8]|uniref:phosphotransferase n=1 Tax=Lacisediminihabitans sp. H27-G8 TaxID=3111909 RepID=UPI0038FD108D
MTFVMHEGQVELAAEEVASAIAAQFKEFAGLPVERVESAGTVVAPFRVGEHVVARLPLVPTDSDVARENIRGEQAHAVVLAGLLDIAVPQMLGIGEPFEGYPGVWTLWTWLPGRSLDRLAVCRDVRLATDLATVLGSIQSLQTGGRPWNGVGRGGRPLADTAWVRKSIDRSAHLIDRAKATQVWERALSARPHIDPPSRIHGDPMPGNFLMDDGVLTGMVDVALPAIGDPAADLQPAWVLFEEPARSTFVTAMGLDIAAQERGLGWAFEMAIGGLHYYEHTNPVFFNQALQTVQRLLTD